MVKFLISFYLPCPPERHMATAPSFFNMPPRHQTPGCTRPLDLLLWPRRCTNPPALSNIKNFSH